MRSRITQLVILLALLLLAAYFITRSERAAPSTEVSTGSPEVENGTLPLDRAATIATDELARATDDIRVSTVRFPDGFEIEVQFRDRPPKAPFDYWPPGVSFALVHARLVEKAENGDMHAAATLYYGAKDCRQTYYDTEERLQDGRNTILETNTLKRIDPVTGNVSVDEVDSGSVDTLLLFIDQQYKRCRWVTDEMKDEMEYWRDRAAELGNVELRRERALVDEGNTPAGRQILLDLFHAGEYRVGRDLGNFLMGNRTPYADKVTAPAGDLWQMQVDGYAYYYLAGLLEEADRSAPKTARWRSYANEELLSVSSQLSPAAQQAGIERAKEILASYQHCCRSSRPYGEIRN